MEISFRVFLLSYLSFVIDFSIVEPQKVSTFLLFLFSLGVNECLITFKSDSVFIFLNFRYLSFVSVGIFLLPLTVKRDVVLF